MRQRSDNEAPVGYLRVIRYSYPRCDHPLPHVQCVRVKAALSDPSTLPPQPASTPRDLFASRRFRIPDSLRTHSLIRTASRSSRVPEENEWRSRLFHRFRR